MFAIQVVSEPAGFFVFVFGLALTIYWMVVPWRLMRSNERLADSVERMEIMLSGKFGYADDKPRDRSEPPPDELDGPV
jgi:hypothetical protein